MLTVTTTLTTLTALATTISDPTFRIPGVCNIFPWFC